MVDSGAKRSVISAEMIAGRNSFKIRATNTCWRTADGEPARNVAGETTLMVRFQGTLVELPRVLVMTNTAYPLMLGIEWIAAVNAAVSAKDGRGVMTLPDPNVGTETKPVVQDPEKIDEEKPIDETQSETQTKSVVSENPESKKIKEEKKESAKEEQNVLPPPLQEKSEKEAVAGVEPGSVAEEEKQEKMNETKVTPSPSKRRIRRNLYPRSLSYIKFG